MPLLPDREVRLVTRVVPRKPEAVEVTSPRLYVGNLSFDATEGELSELFNWRRSGGDC